jgi:hypothetical protein
MRGPLREGDTMPPFGPPFGFDDDEWLAAQFLLFFDETGDEAEARRRVEQLRNQRAARRPNPLPPTASQAPAQTPAQTPASISSPVAPLPRTSRPAATPRAPQRGLLRRFWSWFWR